ncbi:MAG: hypothetical protein GXY76_09200 [Chloroflexi bacterium]|nr:hypothetical protein [Chloroflexota bacterium]
MKNASEYLAHLKSLIILDPQVSHWTVVREEAQGDGGLFRYRLALQDGGLLEMVERFRVVAGEVQVGMYAFHWQDANGALVRRWDNAAHHPEISTYPHHVHEGAEDHVLPHEPVSAERILALVARGA